MRCEGLGHHNDYEDEDEISILHYHYDCSLLLSFSEIAVGWSVWLDASVDYTIVSLSYDDERAILLYLNRTHGGLCLYDSDRFLVVGWL